MKTGLILSIVIGFILFNCFGPGIYKIQTRSMVKKFNKVPQSGDILAFWETDDSRSYVTVKRVFAAAGDTMTIGRKALLSDFRSVPHDMIFTWLRGRVGSKEDQVLDYKAFLLESISETENMVMNPLNSGNEPKIIIPPDHLFLTGDNYSESMDSRFKGFIHSDKVIGKIIAVF